jgi:two-component system cell cycle sensor histidine kinase/response regulator CckA
MQIKDIKTKNRQPVILFADDDKICLDVSALMLKKLGYIVLEARDGKEAIEVYGNYQDKVDLVILDMKMPHNGGHTFEQLKKINADLKIILTSGYT